MSWLIHHPTLKPMRSVRHLGWPRMVILPFLPWLLVVDAGAAPSPRLATVIVSCDEPDAAVYVDGVAQHERTPAALVVPEGPHVVELRLGNSHEKKIVEAVADQQYKLLFEFRVLVRFRSATPKAHIVVDGIELGPLPTERALRPGDHVVNVDAPSRRSQKRLITIRSGHAVTMQVDLGEDPGAPAPLAAPMSPTPHPRATHCTEAGRDVPCEPSRCIQGGKPVACTGVPASPAGVDFANAVPTASTSDNMRATSGAIAITTKARNGVVYIDGVSSYTEAPCTLGLEPGEHLVAVVVDGKVPAETRVRIQFGHTERVELTPTRNRKAANAFEN